VGRRRALREWPITVYPAWGFGELEASIHPPEQVSNPFRLALLAGAAFTWLLIWVSTRFLCWVSATAHGAAKPMRYFVRTLPARGGLLYGVEGCGRLESKKQ